MSVTRRIQTQNGTGCERQCCVVAASHLLCAPRGPGVGTGRQAGFRFQCPSGVRVRLPPWAPCNALPCPDGEIGRHKGLKIPRGQLRAGSTPAPGTIKTMTYEPQLWLNPGGGVQAMFLYNARSDRCCLTIAPVPRLGGRVVMQRTATPCTPVRLRSQPPLISSNYLVRLAV